MEDLKTDWIPDPVGGVGVRPDPMEGIGRDFSPLLSVEIASGPKVVAIAPLEFRAWATVAVSGALTDREATLPKNVFGYRDATTPYRDEWARLRCARTRLSQEFAYVQHADIQAFFATISPDACADILPPMVLQVMERSQAEFGTASCPGIDGQGAWPTSSWERHTYLPLLRYCDGRTTTGLGQLRAALDAGVAGLRRALEKRGLWLDVAKHPNAPAKPRPFPVWEGLGPAAALALLSGASGSADVPLVKYLLRWLTSTADDCAVHLIPEIVARHRVITPRAAMYLASCLPTEVAREALRLRH